MDIIIRELTLDDVDQFRSIRLDMLKKHPSNFGSCDKEEKAFHSDQWVARIKKPNTIIFGVFVDADIVGLSILSINPRRKMKHIGTINSFYIKPDYRRKGLAKKLLAYMEDYAKNASLIRLQLSVMEYNLEAIRLYEQHGFTETGKELDTIYYEGVYYSLRLMTKLLGCDDDDSV